MLAVASAAFAASYSVLHSMPEHQPLAKTCLSHALELYKYAKLQPSIYSDTNLVCAKTYKNDNWQQFVYFSAAWLYEATQEAAYLKVSPVAHCGVDIIQCS
jgi:hypothetical protein